MVPTGNEQFLDSRRNQFAKRRAGIPPPDKRRTKCLRQNAVVFSIFGQRSNRKPSLDKRIHYGKRSQSVLGDSNVSGSDPFAKLRLYARYHLQPLRTQRHFISVERRRTFACAQQLYRRFVQRFSKKSKSVYACADGDCKLYFGRHLFLFGLYVFFTTWGATEK